MTKQREAILSVLQNSSGHMTAEEVFLAVRPMLPGVALATVYNNLNALADSGTIRRVPVCHGSDRFDKTPSPHEHLICSVCGAMTDLETGDLRARLEKLNRIRLTDLELNAYYVCPACQAKKQAAAPADH